MSDPVTSFNGVGMDRLGQTFKKLAANGRKALVTYAMAGDPTLKASLDIVTALAAHADILEIGMPFTDPMADGPVIQAAGLRALANGVGVKSTLELVQKFRSKNHDTPVVLMGYFNPILAYGVEKFMTACGKAGVDGLIVVDIPPEEADEIAPYAAVNGLCLIRLLTPTTDAARLPKVLAGASGFLYYVSITGVTGTASADPVQVRRHIAEIKQHTGLPVVVGFGIKTPADARVMAGMADGIVIGSALIETIAANGDEAVQKVSDQLAELAAAMHD